jgi:arsenite methyltransferase
MDRQQDRWAQWLLNRRFGGDAAGADERAQFMERLLRVRDQILDRSALEPGETLLDVGCGDGLIGFGALARRAGTVIFSDVSADLIAVCRSAAKELGELDRCRFLEADAVDLGALPERSVDVITTRAVLIYAEAKQGAFDEFFRVLRPGGRISVYEPINRFGHDERDEELFWFYPVDGLRELAARIAAVYTDLQPPELDPMLNFDERDLVRHAEKAGFFPIELKLEAEIRPIEPRQWESFCSTAPNPKVPTVVEAMEQALTPEERQQVGAHLRPLVEAGRGIWRMAHAHLYAVKPA